MKTLDFLLDLDINYIIKNKENFRDKRKLEKVYKLEKDSRISVINFSNLSNRLILEFRLFSLFNFDFLDRKTLVLYIDINSLEIESSPIIFKPEYLNLWRTIKFSYDFFLGYYKDTFTNLRTLLDSLRLRIKNSKTNIDKFKQFLNNSPDKNLYNLTLKNSVTKDDININMNTLFRCYELFNPKNCIELMIYFDLYLGYLYTKFKETFDLFNTILQPPLYTEDIITEVKKFIEKNKDEYNKPIILRETLKKANEEYKVLVEGIKSSLSNKYDIPEKYIHEDFYDIVNNRFNLPLTN